MNGSMDYWDWIMDIETGPVERTLSAPQPPRLFDLEADPYERSDLAGQHPQRVHTTRAQGTCGLSASTPSALKRRRGMD